jgi:hypothetical protein
MMHIFTNLIRTALRTFNGTAVSSSCFQERRAPMQALHRHHFQYVTGGDNESPKGSW